MSYVHCGGCGRAFRLGVVSACPACAWRPGGQATLDEALATIEAAVAAQPRLADVVRHRLAGVLAEPVETSMIAADVPGAIATPHDDPRLRTLVAAIVIALAARFQQAAAERPRVKRGIGLARRVLSRFV